MADHLGELFSTIRGLAGFGLVIAVDDSGQVQRVTVKTADGGDRADVEVCQPFGLASVPPAAGAICLLIAVGADPANLMALPICAPAQRYGGQQPGETTMYAQDGTRVSLREGGIVEVWGGSLVTIHSPEVAIIAPDAVNVTATMNVTGDVVINGKSVASHYHSAPGGNTGPMIA